MYEEPKPKSCFFCVYKEKLPTEGSDYFCKYKGVVLENFVCRKFKLDIFASPVFRRRDLDTSRFTDKDFTLED